MYKEIEQLQDIMKNISDRETFLQKELSKIDSEREDILHYIELSKYNAVQGWKLLKTLKEVSQKRRNIKEELGYLSSINSKIPYDSICSSISRKEKKNLDKMYKFRTNIIEEILDKWKLFFLNGLTSKKLYAIIQSQNKINLKEEKKTNE